MPLSKICNAMRSNSHNQSPWIINWKYIVSLCYTLSAKISLASLWLQLLPLFCVNWKKNDHPVSLFHQILLIMNLSVSIIGRIEGSMEYFISGNIMTNSQLNIWDVKIIYTCQTLILRIQAISNDTQKLQINKQKSRKSPL